MKAEEFQCLQQNVHSICPTMTLRAERKRHRWSLSPERNPFRAGKIVSGNFLEAGPECSVPRGKNLSSAVDPMDQVKLCLMLNWVV
jgi:hypothetical protein